MGDTLASFLGQIKEWEQRMAEAEAILREGEKVLPRLKEIVRDLNEDRAKCAETEVPPPPAAEEMESYNGELRELRASRQVQGAVVRALPHVPQTFTQNEVDRVIRSQGNSVNRSTLRVTLLLLARLPDSGLEVAEEGRGRRATTFRKT